MTRHLLLGMLLFALLGAQSAWARPKVGLVLGGGGARGLAHVGVIKVLEREHVPVDCITGTSAGALIGGMYAAGMPVDEIERRLLGADWRDLFDSRLARQSEDFRIKQDDRNYALLQLGVKDGEIGLPRGAVRAQKIELFIRELTMSTGPESFDSLPIPFRSMATDLETGNLYAFDHGDLATAMRASMSVPGAFEPVQAGGKLLVDGGLARNLPIAEVREMCHPDVVIVVNVGSPPLKRKDLESIFGVMQQMIDIGINRNVEEQLRLLGPNDILIKPELGDIGSTEFERVADIIPKGEAAAASWRGRLAALAVDAASFEAELAKRQTKREPASRVDEIRIAETGKVNPDTISARIKQPLNTTLDQERLHRELLAIYGSGDFDVVDYQLVHEGGRNVLHIRPIEKYEGVDTLRFGLSLAATSHDTANFTLDSVYKKRWVNSLGAEWRAGASIGNRIGLFSEFYQPLSVDGPLFVSPLIRFQRRFSKLYQDGDAVAEFQERHLLGAVDLGLSLGEYGELRVGAFRDYATGSVTVGLPIGGERQNLGGLRASLIVDKVNNASFPTAGGTARISYAQGMQVLGGDQSYRRVAGGWEGAFNLGNHVIQAAMRGGDSLGTTLPFTEQFTLGGFLNMTGYAPDEFRGDRFSYGRLTYLWRKQMRFAKAFYVGVSAEMGQVGRGTDSFSSGGTKGSLGMHVGFDTLIGPLYLGYGHGEGGRNAVYLYIGPY